MTTDDDPGPIWEHLPGAWDPGPATGEVVDGAAAIEHIEDVLADIREDVGPGEPARSIRDVFIGLRMLFRSGDDRQDGD